MTSVKSAILLFAVTPIAFALTAGAQNTNPTPPSVPLAPDAPFTVAVSTTTLEGGPVYVADAGPMGAGFRVINGGVRHLANGGAHAATNAQTQFLIAGAPNVRILFTVAEGMYRIVAKRLAGIRSLADLRGKRITTPRDTFAHYALVRMLATAGLAESDVTLVDLPRGQIWAGVVKGQADAISMWEPEAQNPIDGLGADGIVFQDNKVYRELFSLLDRHLELTGCWSGHPAKNDPARRSGYRTRSRRDVLFSRPAGSLATTRA